MSLPQGLGRWALAEAWAGNVFPKMNVTWNSSPNHIGHGGVATKAVASAVMTASTQARPGMRSPRDCSQCHELLADQEKKPVPVS